jgi:hypothetical protein
LGQDHLRTALFRHHRAPAMQGTGLVEIRSAPPLRPTQQTTQERYTMAGIELLIMPLVTMGSAVVFGVSQIRSVTRDDDD